MNPVGLAKTWEEGGEKGDTIKTRRQRAQERERVHLCSLHPTLRVSGRRSPRAPPLRSAREPHDGDAPPAFVLAPIPPGWLPSTRPAAATATPRLTGPNPSRQHRLGQADRGLLRRGGGGDFPRHGPLTRGGGRKRHEGKRRAAVGGSPTALTFFEREIAESQRVKQRARGCAASGHLGLETQGSLATAAKPQPPASPLYTVPDASPTRRLIGSWAELLPSHWVSEKKRRRAERFVTMMPRPPRLARRMGVAYTTAG